MSRRFVAFAVLALTGAALAVPDPSHAGPGGFRGGGFHAGGIRAGGFRAPFMPRGARAGILRTGPGVALRQGAVQLRLPAAPKLAHGLARTTVRAPFARLERQHHRGYYYGYGYPITTYGDTGYYGTPYDPAEAIPVYAPPSITELADPPAPPPRLSSTREDNADACRSERVTVPASGGEREITVVRC
jgi:hypothetical protein